MRPKDWWKDAVIYQIYTRSFQDSNGVGIGDFQGIISRLDYIKNLGVDIIWLSPFFKSPNDDNGYDVSDYREVNPEFGTLEDLKQLIFQAKTMGMEVMMDLVFNHTSDEHPWFVESKSSLSNPKRHWYHWAKSKNPGEAPNNWNSYFGGSTWELDPITQEYYLHIFSKKQPDLNWSNPEVRKELHDIAHFWIDLGIGAFRLDAIHHIGKPEGYPDYPKASDVFRLYKNIPETHAYLKEFREMVCNPRGILTVGETGGTTPQSSRLYVDQGRKELDMIFHFDHHWLRNPRDPVLLGKTISDWYKPLSKQGWDAQFFSNHDLPRQVSVFGDEGPFRRASAQTIATLLLTSWGTPYLYQGEEIGMTNSYFPKPEDYQDKHALQHYYDSLNKGEDPTLAWDMFQARGRDSGRTPMPWSTEPQGGFTQGAPWIALGSRWPEINVETDQSSPSSVFVWYQKLILLRKKQVVLRRGDFQLFGEPHPQVLAYTRYFQEPQGRKVRALVVLNWTRGIIGYTVKGNLRGAKPREFHLAEGNYARTEINPSNPIPLPVLGEELPQKFTLRPWESRIYIT